MSLPNTTGDVEINDNVLASLPADLIEDFDDEASPEEQPKRKTSPDEGKDEQKTGPDEDGLDPADIDDEPEAKDAAETPTKVTLKSGETVTLAELEAGYLKQADYTRKTQEVAEQRRHVAEAQGKLTEAEREIKATADLAIAVLQQYLPAQPDMHRIETDPVGYLREKAAYDAAVRDLDALVKSRAAHDARNFEQTDAQRQELIQKEWASLLEKRPEFKTREALERFRNDAVEYGAKIYGATPEEIAQITDHRLISILDDAIKYRKLLDRKAGAVIAEKRLPPVHRPGQSRPLGERDRIDREKQTNRLRQTGSIDDAAALLPDDI